MKKKKEKKNNTQKTNKLLFLFHVLRCCMLEFVYTWTENDMPKQRTGTQQATFQSAYYIPCQNCAELVIYSGAVHYILLTI